MSESEQAEESYDSGPETREHIAQVARRLANVRVELQRRAQAHDASKLGPEEKPIFDQVTPKLKGLVYGSDEYRASLKELGPALTHHYAVNSHHPEHWPDGIADMDLLDLIEMYCDWAAATLRTKDGDMAKGIEHNVGRFKMDAQLAAVFRNTLARHGGFAGYSGHDLLGEATPLREGWSAATDVNGQFFQRKPNRNLPLNPHGHPAT